MVSEGSAENAAESTSSSGMRRGKLYAGGDESLMLGQDVLSSIPTSVDGSGAPGTDGCSRCACFSLERRFWASKTISSRMVVFEAVMLISTGFDGAVPVAVGEVKML